MDLIKKEILRVLEEKIEEKNTVDYEGYWDYIYIQADELTLPFPKLTALVDSDFQRRAGLQYIAALSNATQLCFFYYRPRVRRLSSEGREGYQVSGLAYVEGRVDKFCDWVSLEDFETLYRNRVPYVEVE